MKKRGNLALMWRMLGLVKPLSGYMVLAVLMGLVGHLCAAFLMVLGGYAILDFLGMPAPVTMQTAFLFLGIFALLRGVLRYAEQACNHYIAFKLLAHIRDKVFKALRRLCPAKLESKDKGNLISVITTDIELLEVFYAHTISPIIIAFLFTIFLCLFIGSYHWILGVVALVAHITVGILIPFLLSKASRQDGAAFRTKAGDLSSFVLDSLRGVSETLQYGNGKKRLAEMNERTDSLAVEEERMKRVAGLGSSGTNAVVLLFDLSMLFISAILYIRGMVGFEGVLIPVTALFSSFGPVIALAALGSTLQNTFAAGRRVLDILDESPEVDEVTGQDMVDFTGAQVKDLNFSYGEETILSGVSLSIPEHSVIGITGRSGSGKSTLLRLLMRFWKVPEGSIEISEREIGQINTGNLRAMESFVTQDTHLFQDSIENNIRIAKLDATRGEIETACKKASVHEFIKNLPRGYETPVGELGDTLSGGEKQRIGLARAFLHDAPFMLLDEPTSNLDSLNEAVILKSLKEERGGRTVVLVSHRQSTMRIADRIYSVENGRMS